MENILTSVSEDKQWHVVGLESEIEEQGQYITCEVDGEPVVVVRGEDNVMRALSRVCRHRGFDLLEGAFNPDGDLQGRCGEVQRLRCPYHAWTYSLDGRLMAAPMSNEIEGFDKRDIRLPQFDLKVENREVFVCVKTLIADAAVGNAP